MHTAALAVALAVATGCSGSDSYSGADPGRQRAPSCGAYVAPLGELSPDDAAVRQCFLDAFRTGEVKEVTITATTVEGDAIVTTYRVAGTDAVDLFVDASADTFAEVKMYRQRCTGVAAEGTGLAATGCVDVR